jgi:hypothetical protein
MACSRRRASPRPIIDRLADLTRAAVAAPDVQQALIKSGFETIADSGARQQVMANELKRWAPVIKAANFKT